MSSNSNFAVWLAPPTGVFIAITSAFSSSYRSMKIHIFSHFEIKQRNIFLTSTNKTNFLHQSFSKTNDRHSEFQPKPLTISSEDSFNSINSSSGLNSQRIYINTIVIRALKPLRIVQRCMSCVAILLCFEHQSKIEVKVTNSRIFTDRSALIKLSEIADQCSNQYRTHKTTAAAPQSIDPSSDSNRSLNFFEEKEDEYTLFESAIVDGSPEKLDVSSHVSACSSQSSRSSSPSPVPVQRAAASSFEIQSPSSSASLFLSESLETSALSTSACLPPPLQQMSAAPMCSVPNPRIESDFCPRCRPQAHSASGPHPQPAFPVQVEAVEEEPEFFDYEDVPTTVIAPVVLHSSIKPVDLSFDSMCDATSRSSSVSAGVCKCYTCALQCNV